MGVVEIFVYRIPLPKTANKKQPSNPNSGTCMHQVQLAATFEKGKLRS